MHSVLAQNVGKSSPCLPYFPTISAEPERKESLRPAFPTLSAGSKHREVSPCLPYFPTFSADPTRRESLRLAFPISLHLVLALNVVKVFALPSLFPYN